MQNIFSGIIFSSPWQQILPEIRRLISNKLQIFFWPNQVEIKKTQDY